MRLAEDLAAGHPRVGQPEAVAAPVAGRRARRAPREAPDSGRSVATRFVVVDRLRAAGTRPSRRISRRRAGCSQPQRGTRGRSARGAPRGRRGASSSESSRGARQLGGGRGGGAARRARGPPRATPAETSGFFFWRIAAMKSASRSRSPTAIRDGRELRVLVPGQVPEELAFDRLGGSQSAGRPSSGAAAARAARRSRKSRRKRKRTASGPAEAACARHSRSIPKSRATKRASGRAASTRSRDRETDRAKPARRARRSAARRARRPLAAARRGRRGRGPRGGPRGGGPGM